MSASQTAGRNASSTDDRLHKPGVAGSSPAAAIVSATITHESAEEYHNRPELNCSKLKDLDSSPVEFYLRHISGEAPPKSSTALDYGWLLHQWHEIGEDRFWNQIAVPPESVLTATGQLGKAGKEWLADQPPGSIVVTPNDRRQLFDQTRQILKNSAARQLIEAAVDREFNVTFAWDGTPCRSRIDGATKSVWYDLKTTREKDPFKTAWRATDDFKYGLQSAFYAEAARQAGWPDHKLHFIWTSNVFPHHCVVATLPDALVARARRRISQLIAELKSRTEWDSWLPPYYGQVVELSCPAFMLKEEGGE